MATQYKRQVSIFINGKEISNDIKSISSEFNKATANLAKLTRGSEEYNKQLQEVGKLKTILIEHRKAIADASGEMQKQQGVVGKLTDGIKGLGAALSFAAIVAGAKYAFDKVIKATDAMNDKWEEVTGAMGAATSYFWTTLASGDWHNFFTNLAEASRLGAAYARMLDELGDRQRALSIEEADAQKKILDLEVKLKNKTLSKEERLAAGQERIRIEEDLSKIRSDNAEKAFNNELQNNIKFVKLGKDRTMQLMTDMDSQDRKDAEIYNSKRKRIESLQNTQIETHVTTYGTPVTTGVDNSKEIVKLNAEIAKTPQNIKDYGQSLEQFDKITEEERDKLVQTYVSWKEAQNSVIQNTKRIRSQVNSLLAGEVNDQKKAAGQQITADKKATDKKLKVLEAAKIAEISAIEKRHNEGKSSESQYQDELLNQELKFLSDKMALYNKGSKEYTDTEQKYNDLNLKSLETSNNEEIAIINKRHLNGITSESQYEDELLTQEIKFLADKMNLYDNGSKEYAEAESKYIEKQLKQKQKINDLLLKAQQELSNITIENIKDSVEKERATEDKSWQDELAALNTRKIVKNKLSAEEIGINDAINKIIEQKQVQHNEKMASINKEGLVKIQKEQFAAEWNTKFNEFLKLDAGKQKDAFIKKFMEAGDSSFQAFLLAFEKAGAEGTIAGAIPVTDESSASDVALNYALKKYSETEEGKLDILKARLDAGKIGEQEYEDEVTRIHTEAENKRRQITEQRLQAAQDLTSMASNLVSAMMDLELEKAGNNEEKKNEIRKKYANIQFTASAAQIVVDTATAIMKGYAQLGPFAGTVAAVLLSAIGAVQLATANAQRKNMVEGKGYAEGGYTSPGETNEPAGIVHKNEWVAPAWMVEDFRMGEIINDLERVRQTGKTSSLIPNTDGMVAALQSFKKNRIIINPEVLSCKISTTRKRTSQEYATGGYVNRSDNQERDNKMNELLLLVKKSLDDNTTATRDFMNWKPKVYTEMIKKDLDNLESIRRNRGL
jgi:hypothetical protein